MFIGRQQEITQLERALSDSEIQMVGIYGVGGCGKTTLVHFVVSQPKIADQFPGSIIWVNCNTEDSLPKILKILANTFGIESASLTISAVRDAVITKLRTQATLIVFDEYERVVQNDEVLSFIGRLPKLTKVLIISRKRIRIPNQDITIRLDSFTESEAMEFLKQQLEPQQLANIDQVALQEIYRLTSGLPLALTIVTGWLKQDTSLSAILRSLDYNDQLINFTTDDQFETVYKNLLAQAITILSEPELKFIAALSVFAHPAEGEAIATVAEIEDWRLSANALAQKSMVVVVDARYALHPLLQTYLRSQLSPELLLALQQRMVQHFLAYVKEYQFNFEQLDREWLNIQYSIETASNNKLWQEFLEFILTIAQFQNTRGYESKYEQWLNHAVELSENLDDTYLYASLLHNLGVFHQQRGELSAALAAYQKCLYIGEKSGDLLTVGNTIAQLGTVNYQMRNFNKAEKLYHQSLEIYERVGDRRNVSSILGNLGLIYAHIGRYQEAEEIFKQSLAINREIGDRLAEAVLLANLGWIFIYKGDYEGAQEILEESLTINREIGNRPAEASLLANLGAVYTNLQTGSHAENLERAIQAYQAALSVYTREAFPEQWASVQNDLGSVYSKRIQGDRAENLERAIQAYQAALSVYTHEAFPEQWASVQNNLGSVYRNRIQGDRVENLERAIQAYQAALSVYTREAFPFEWAASQSNLGNAYLNRLGDSSKNLEQAIAYYQNVLTVYTREAFPLEWAGTLSNLGVAYSQQVRGDRMENLRQAISSYELALEVYTKECFPRDWLRVTTHLSTAYAEMGNWSKAKEMATNVLQAFRGAIADAESVEALTPWYQQFGELAIQNNDPEVAIHIFAEAAYRFELQKLKVPDVICKKLTSLKEVLGEESYSIIWAEVQGILTPILAHTLHDARYLMHEEQFSEAFDKLSSALEMLSETKDTKLLCKQRATILFLSGFCLRKQGDWDAALKQQEQSFKLFEKIKDFFNTARVLLEKGHLYEVMNNYEDARICYMDAYRHSRLAEDKNGMASASEQLGRIEYRVRLFPQAVKNLEEARKLYITLGKHTKATAIQSDIEDAKAGLIYQNNKKNTGA
jgi:tetratricopeptide (TPR) repeat protein